ncbi:hypothetical protein V7112_08775 [Bacillus sp. JJ1566]|uniref:DUF6414 family protein n=1 Tax=Bacillus sp. JJ1566 TaxID=3122961 RepID=UPI002FFEA6BB
MKEIIYLDTNILNSMLAQLDEGIIDSFSMEEDSQKSETEEHSTTRGKNAGVKGQVKLSTGLFPGGELLLGSNLDNNGNETLAGSRTILEGQKDILNKAFHDYALDILQSKLEQLELFVSGPDFKEGDLHLGEDTFKFYDFDLLKNVIDSEHLNKLMLFNEQSPIGDINEALEILERKRKGKLSSKDQNKIDFAESYEERYEALLPILNTFKILETFSTYSASALGNSVIIKAGNKIGFLKKDYLRDSSVALSFRTDKSRNVKFLVRIIGIKETVYNENNMPTFNTDDLDLIPNMIFDLLLGSFGIIKPNDVLVTPIAIYYE